MVEVFKTDVSDEDQAKHLLNRLRLSFSIYEFNFDLEDCDKILRVESSKAGIKTNQLLEFLINSGISAEILPDLLPQQHLPLKFI